MADPYARILDAAYWHRRAEELRTIADGLKGAWPDLAAFMLERAKWEQSLADQAEDRKNTRSLANRTLARARSPLIGA